MDSLTIGKDGMLGKLAGVFSTIGENRNGYPANENSFRHAFSSEIFLEKIKNGGLLGRVDHTNYNEDVNPNDETLLKEAGIIVKQVPEIRKDGTIYGEAYILNTPNGQIAYVLAKAGILPGISYRGGIDSELYNAGREEEAWDQFEIEAFDLVYVPAYEEARLQLVEDYVDNSSAQASAKKKAGVNIAQSIMKVAASAKQQEKLLKAVSVLGSLDKQAIIDANKELSEASPNYAADDVKEKAKRLSKTDGEDINPKHIAPKQEGNITMMAHDEETDDKEEVITEKKIDVLNKENSEETLDPVLPLKQMVENIHEGKKAGLSPNDAQKKIEEGAKEIAEELVEEEKEKLENKKAGLEKGMAAGEEGEEKEGDLKGGDEVAKLQTLLKKLKQAEKDYSELIDEYRTYRDWDQVDAFGEALSQIRQDIKDVQEKLKVAKNAGFIGVASNDDDPDIQLVDEHEEDYNSDDEDSGKPATDDSDGENEDLPLEEKLAAEIQRLTDIVSKLEAKTNELTGELDNRNAEYNTLKASYDKLKATTAHAVDVRKNIEEQCAKLRASNNEMAAVMEQTKKVHAQSQKRLREQINDLNEVVASLKKDREVSENSMKVTQAALAKAEKDKRVLAGAKADVLGRLAIRELADVYGVNAESLMAKKSIIKDRASLNNVIASLQKSNGRVVASRFYATQGVDLLNRSASNPRYAIPEEIAETLELYDQE